MTAAMLPLVLLWCDGGKDCPPYGLEHQHRRGEESFLRKKACEDGWTSVRSPGAPWHVKDYCPGHSPT